MDEKPAIVLQLRRRSVKSQASPSIFMGKQLFCLLAVASALRCKDDAISTFTSHSGRISMTKTVASLTAVAVLYAFTSVLAQAPESVTVPTDPPVAPAPQATSPSSTPAPSMEAPKVQGDKEKRGEMSREHRERGKSRVHRKDGEHKRHGKHRDKHENGIKHGDRGMHKRS
jgi:hypothetical protein